MDPRKTVGLARRVRREQAAQARVPGDQRGLSADRLNSQERQASKQVQQVFPRALLPKVALRRRLWEAGSVTGLRVALRTAARSAS